MSRWSGRVVVLVSSFGIISALAALPVFAADPTFGWPQWGQNPQHQGFVTTIGQAINRPLAQFTYDPFVPQEMADQGGDLLVHYQVPLLAGQDAFMAFKTGSYTGEQTWNTQIFNQRRLHWQNGSLVEMCNFQSGWKPEPNPTAVGSSPTERWGLRGWEPVYHAVLANGFLYDQDFAGTLTKLNPGDCSVASRINPFGSIDPNKYVSGPPVADGAGNVYFNVLQLDPNNPYGINNPNDEQGILGFTDIPGAWLVKVAPDDSTTMVSYKTLISNAPTSCVTTFTLAQLPWPPSPTGTPPMGPCGSQRPGINVAPAIAPDGTIYTVSRAHLRSRYGYVVALNSNLSLKWAASLRDVLNDGCGVLLPAATKDGGCTKGATLGVDPATNQPAGGRVIDQSSSSPTVAPDGSVLYGSYTRYNWARGHLFRFSPGGQFLASYDFGWDSTVATYQHNGTFSVVIKDNHYDVGTYCNDPKICPVAPPGPYFITQLTPNLVPEWKFKSTNTLSCRRNPDGTLSCVSDHPGGFEWCINAPAIDGNGVVYANSEDGNLYAINQGGTLKQNLFLKLALGAAYTPLSISADGKIYTENDGLLFVVGQ
jgi:outer membrane protein assembly factor BamB